MTEALQQAVHQVQQLPDETQNAVADLIQAELASEARWDASFVASPDLLERLADEALSEHRAGLTRPFPKAS